MSERSSRMHLVYNYPSINSLVLNPNFVQEKGFNDTLFSCEKDKTIYRMTATWKQLIRLDSVSHQFDSQGVLKKYFRDFDFHNMSATRTSHASTDQHNDNTTSLHQLYRVIKLQNYRC